MTYDGNCCNLEDLPFKRHLLNRGEERESRSHREWFKSRLLHVNRMLVGCSVVEEAKMKIAVGL